YATRLNSGAERRTATVRTTPARNYSGNRMTDTSWPSAFSCPECLEHSGLAQGVASHRPGKIVVEVRCKQCGHEWQLERDIPTYALRPKKDRRQRPRSFVPIVTLN
ncbi:MAG: hypothetical protein ABI039_10280, partial [Vicinamibacterales bacterium]